MAEMESLVERESFGYIYYREESNNTMFVTHGEKGNEHKILDCESERRRPHARW
jgi:hypothetical protein